MLCDILSKDMGLRLQWTTYSPYHYRSNEAWIQEPGEDCLRISYKPTGSPTNGHKKLEVMRAKDTRARACAAERWESSAWKLKSLKMSTVHLQYCIFVMGGLHMNVLSRVFESKPVPCCVPGVSCLLYIQNTSKLTAGFIVLLFLKYVLTRR